MTPQELVARLPLQKGGSGKASRDETIVDTMVHMAEAHTRVTRKAYELTGISEEVLNESSIIPWQDASFAKRDISADEHIWSWLE